MRSRTLRGCVDGHKGTKRLSGVPSVPFRTKVIRSDSEELFLGKLKGVTDPELKRKVIGNTFIEVFDHEATKLKDVKWLAQGTIYPDVIESAGADTGKAQKLELANGKDAIALKSADKVVPTLNAWIEAVQGSEFDALLNKEVASLRRVK